MKTKIILGFVTLLILGAGIFCYVTKYVNKDSKQDRMLNTDIVQTEEAKEAELALKKEIEATEDSPNERFIEQPGEIKILKEISSEKWVMSLDILTRNPDWIPGENDFFINRNPKIRDYIITPSTRVYVCGEGLDGNSTTPDVEASFTEYIRAIENDSHRVRYFDIRNGRVLSIYNQCLP